MQLGNQNGLRTYLSYITWKETTTAIIGLICTLTGSGDMLMLSRIKNKIIRVTPDYLNVVRIYMEMRNRPFYTFYYRRIHESEFEVRYYA